MKHPFLILAICILLPGLIYSQTDTSAAARDTAAVRQAPAAVSDTTPAVRQAPAVVSDTTPAVREVPAAVPDTTPPARELPAVVPPAVSDTTAGATAGETEAQATWDIVASGGWTFPYEPTQFIDHFKTNYNFGGGIAYVLPPGEVGYGEVSLLAHYYNVLFTRSGFRKANNIPENVGVYGYPGDVYTGMIQFRGVYTKSKDRIAPFFTVAFGIYHIALPALGRLPSTELYPEYKKTTIGWSAGVGVDVPIMERITLFVDGNFLLGVTETNGHKLFAAGGGVRYHL